jgi:hypothetical protein
VTVSELDRMSQMDINNVDRTQLVDIQTISIDPLQSVIQRMESYLDQIKNPYCFLCDDAIVRVRFEQGEKSLTHRLKKHYVSIKIC